MSRGPFELLTEITWKDDLGRAALLLLALWLVLVSMFAF